LPVEAEKGMAGWDRNAGWNRDVLEHIAALLFALAALADLAAGVSVLRRRRVLGILRHGEAEGRAFVVGVATGSPVSADAPETTADAMRLAASFRALALALCAMLARRRFEQSGGDLSRTGWQRPAKPADLPALPPTLDTS
jgi:hypothetical protein